MTFSECSHVILAAFFFPFALADDLSTSMALLIIVYGLDANMISSN